MNYNYYFVEVSFNNYHLTFPFEWQYKVFDLKEFNNSLNEIALKQLNVNRMNTFGNIPNINNINIKPYLVHSENK
jgi:hypothetical protein